jgi:hypothetical protein
VRKTPVPALPAPLSGAKRRGPNFSPEEDVFLTRAWCCATEDSRKGNGQKQQDFNKTLFGNYVSLVDEFNDQVRSSLRINLESRNQKGIVDRFAKIKKAASQFAGVVARNKIKSGETSELHMKRCCTVFEMTHKTKFMWLECYEILEELPKWNSQHEDGQKMSATGKRKAGTVRSTGKRTKALTDKIDKMLEKHGTTGTAAGQATSLSAVGTLNQMTSHMVEQLNFAHWTQEDKSMYFAQDAQEKALLQQKRILMLKQEVATLRKKEATGCLDESGSSGTSKEGSKTSNEPDPDDEDDY